MSPSRSGYQKMLPSQGGCEGMEASQPERQDRLSWDPLQNENAEPVILKGHDRYQDGYRGPLKPSEHGAPCDHTGHTPVKAPRRQFKFPLSLLFALWETLFQSTDRSQAPHS